MSGIPSMLSQMKFYLLASGSKGNCCVIRTSGTQLVIDCGTTKKYLKSCFESLDLKVSETDALLLTHGHKDHIAQLKMFSSVKRYASFDPGVEGNQQWIRPYDSFMIKDLKVTVLPMSHDAVNPVGFIIESESEKLVYVTDTGYIHEDCLPLMRDPDYVILESNHDVGMLMKTARPYPIKMRILSDSGHLCNEDCAHILTQIVTPKTKSVFLAHLSEEGNDPELAVQVSAEALSRCHCNPDMILKAAGQYEILKGGAAYEEVSDCSYRTIGSLELNFER